MNELKAKPKGLSKYSQLDKNVLYNVKGSSTSFFAKYQSIEVIDKVKVVKVIYSSNTNFNFGIIKYFKLQDLIPTTIKEKCI